MKKFFNWTLAGYVALILAVSAPAVGQYVSQSLGTMAFQNSNAVVMTGNVGVNTSTPASYLLGAQGLVSHNAAGAPAISISGTVTTDATFGDLLFFNNGTRQGVVRAERIGGDTSSLMRFYISNAGALTEAARWTSGGFPKFTTAQKVLAANSNRTSVTLSNITGLSVTLLAAGTYNFRAFANVTADAVGGSKFAVSGTATATAISYSVVGYNLSTPAVLYGGVATALDTAAGGAGGTAHSVVIEGTITVNAAGTLTIQAAQNVGSGTSTILRGATLTVWEL